MAKPKQRYEICNVRVYSTTYESAAQLCSGAILPSRATARCFATVIPLRLDPDQAADIVWATNANEMYQLLVGQRGWSPQRYEHFLADTWHRLLLAD